MQVLDTYLGVSLRINGIEVCHAALSGFIGEEDWGTMPNSWGRPPRNEIWQDLQALALWILIIGIVGYILFPTFFKDVYSHLTTPAAETSTLNTDYTLDNTSSTDSTDPLASTGQDFSNVYNALYNGKSEVSSGYWIIFVADGEFRQLAVSSDSYAYLLRLIESDQNAVVKNSLILAANGQIRKFVVSDEIYAIISNMSTIDGRSKK